ncbi:Vacuolar protein sorting-associated protein 13B [Liparis tanakae]|uniref:Vacuolar protein sorting-associated protein 13B n=1 Tax=Liparis tanakae TaxID=230148 RepID=A0A4Z2E9V7_9TELE|nr:Vacuolar protein sorting-associated protein 13B [Liparis tanakae]
MMVEDFSMYARSDLNRSLRDEPLVLEKTGGVELQVLQVVSYWNQSRPLSIPMKVMPDTAGGESWTTSEERMKELIAHAWDVVKRLTLQDNNKTLGSAASRLYHV